MEHVSVGQPVAKTGLAVTGAGGAQVLEASQQATMAVAQEVVHVFGFTLADWATIIAIGYTLCLWGEWAWRKFVRPVCEAHGWVRRLRRRTDDTLAD